MDLVQLRWAVFRASEVVAIAPSETRMSADREVWKRYVDCSNARVKRCVVVLVDDVGDVADFPFQFGPRSSKLHQSINPRSRSLQLPFTMQLCGET